MINITLPDGEVIQAEEGTKIAGEAKSEGYAEGYREGLSKAEAEGDEIRANAVSASTRDPRFHAVSEDELPFLEYSVDVLAPAEPVESADDLDPKRFGVIVSLGSRRGLLLPDLEGINDAETQISIAMQKAGIAAQDRFRVRLERFEVIRYH